MPMNAWYGAMILTFTNIRRYSSGENHLVRSGLEFKKIILPLGITFVQEIKVDLHRFVSFHI